MTQTPYLSIPQTFVFALLCLGCFARHDAPSTWVIITASITSHDENDKRNQQYKTGIALLQQAFPMATKVNSAKSSAHPCSLQNTRLASAANSEGKRENSNSQCPVQ